MATTNASQSPRVHIVLVPGFAGFDALGQLEYYAGVTPLLRKCQGRLPTPVVLHYFDNLPTASVATRACRLRHYLAKRLARGELQPGDRIALVGHSTGGLDIRRLLLDLADLEKQGRPIAVDGHAQRMRASPGEAVQVPPGAVFEMIGKVVFLSVPQLGTNIANWVRAHPFLRRRVVDALRAAILGANLSPLNSLEASVNRVIGTVADADLFLAVRDAVREMDARAASGPEQIAEAHEAGSELSLFLANIASDFKAIDDLAVVTDAASASPAHATEERRRQELEMWRRRRIVTRSYATVGKRPYRFEGVEEGERAPAWELRNPFTGPAAGIVSGSGADVSYLVAYRACAGGPFFVPPGQRAGTRFRGGGQRTVELWDNDGIVNTASMLWPNGTDTRVVDGDHGDIIGHYHLVDAPCGGLRDHHTYDLLRSDSGFDDATFSDVWGEVFEFCVADEDETSAPGRSFEPLLEKTT